MEETGTRDRTSPNDPARWARNSPGRLPKMASSTTSERHCRVPRRWLSILERRSAVFSSSSGYRSWQGREGLGGRRVQSALDTLGGISMVAEGYVFHFGEVSDEHLFGRQVFVGMYNLFRMRHPQDAPPIPRISYPQDAPTILGCNGITDSECYMLDSCNENILAAHISMYVRKKGQVGRQDIILRKWFT